MQTLTKVLCHVLNVRLVRYVDAAAGQYVSETQAGFRINSEAIAQVTALYELCKRRSLTGHHTYLVFLDIKKSI